MWWPLPISFFYLYAFFISYCGDIYLLYFVSHIQEQMLSRGLELVGWYHSHPVSLPNPSHNDILSQRMYQYKMMTSGGEEPCVGIVVGEGTCVSGYVKWVWMRWVWLAWNSSLVCGRSVCGDPWSLVWVYKVCVGIIVVRMWGCGLGVRVRGCGSMRGDC